MVKGVKGANHSSVEHQPKLNIMSYWYKAVFVEFYERKKRYRPKLCRWIESKKRNLPITVCLQRIQTNKGGWFVKLVTNQEGLIMRQCVSTGTEWKYFCFHVVAFATSMLLELHTWTELLAMKLAEMPQYCSRAIKIITQSSSTQ